MTHPLTTIPPRTFPLSRPGVVSRTAGVAGFALLTALAAQIQLPVPGTPVPITLQTLVVPLAALTLGGRLGATAMALYLALALLGMPVLAHAEGGVRFVFGATGGYLLGYMLAQPLIARGVRRRDGAYAGMWGLVQGVALGYAVIFALGVGWLKLRTGMSWGDSIAQGLLPFIPGDLVKAGIVLLIGQAAAPWSIRRGLR